MGEVTDRDRTMPKPFLIEADGGGAFRLVLRAGRYNSQNYPVITSTPVDETFHSTAAARAYAKDHFSAVAGEFELPPRGK